MESRGHTNRLATLRNLGPAGKACSVFGGVIFCRAARDDIYQVEDLKGRTFMAVEENSLGGWMAAFREMKDCGLALHDLGALRFGGTHEAVVRAVRSGEVDAGTVRTGTLERMAIDGAIDIGEFRVIHRRMNDGFPFLQSTRLYPEWPIAKVKHTDDELARHVAAALLDMPEESPAAKASGSGGWTVPSNYRPVHECLKELGEAPYENFGKADLAATIERYWNWIVTVALLVVALLSVTLYVLQINRRLRRSRAALRTELEERKKTEAALRESEERYRDLFENANDLIQSVAPDGSFIYVNRAWRETLGYSQEEVAELSLFDVIHPDSRAHCMETFQQVMQNKKIGRVEAVFIARDGREVTLEGSVSCRFIDGKPSATRGIFRNITERKRAEEDLRRHREHLEELVEERTAELKEAVEKLQKEIAERKAAEAALLEGEKKYRDLVENINDVIYVVDDSGTVIYVSPAIRGLSEYGPAEVIGRPFGDFIHEEDLSAVLEHFEKSASGDAGPTECRMKTKSGRTRWIRISIRRVMGEDGTFIGLRGVFTDITERKEAEEALKKVNRALLTLSECNQMLVRARSEDELLEGVCRVLIGVGGYRMAWVGFAEEDEKKSIRPAAWAGHVDGYLEEAQVSWSEDEHGRGPPGVAVRTGEPSAAKIATDPRCAPWREAALKRNYRSMIALPLRTPEKVIGVLNIYSSAEDAFDEEEEVRLLVELSDDLSYGIMVLRARAEKEKLQEQFLQAQKMESVGRLAGGVAHDFNNMLTIIKGHAELAMAETAEGTSVHFSLERIHKAAMRASDLTRQLLAFSRKQPLKFAPVDVNGTIEDLSKMLRRLLGEDVIVRVDLGESVWPVRADRSNIEQVIMNLVVNARDAMPDGGTLFIKTENVEVDEEYTHNVADARVGRFVRISVEDTGTGMDRETTRHIFEPFFTTKAPGKGTGLGLSVVYGIVRQHEGWINVYSEKGRGTVFNIYLPALPGREVEESGAGASPGSLRGRGERIMVVEDEEEVRALAVRVLDENGYKAYAAASAEEALALFEREKGDFDLLFSDVVLPGKSGLELAEEMTARNPRLRLLMCSGYADHKSQWPLIKKRGMPFLQKPFAVTDLLEAVRKALAGGREADGS